MPIDASLLERIKKHDPSLKTLVLTKQQLNDSDIQQLVNALTANTTLTELHVGSNQIGAEGAKALAANTTLTELYVGNNQLGDEGAKALAANSTLITLHIWINQIGAEGAKALATNTTLTELHVGRNEIGDEGAKALAVNTALTTLNVMYNQIGNEGAKVLAANTTLTTLNAGGNPIGDEGAKALVANSTLTSLNVEYNQIGAEVEEQLKQAIARNNQQLISRRNQFIRALIILAYDKANPNSQSLWSRLPQEIMLSIISFIDFRPFESIGKNAQQIKACAIFIFNNVSHMKASLTEAVKTQQNLKIMEKMAQGKRQFTFFPLPPQPTSANVTHAEEINIPLKKIQTR